MSVLKTLVMSMRSLSVISDIPMPTGKRFLVGSGANNTISRNDVCTFCDRAHQVTVQVLEVGMRTIERAEKGIDGVLVRVDPEDTSSLVGRVLEFRSPPP